MMGRFYKKVKLGMADSDDPVALKVRWGPVGSFGVGPGPYRVTQDADRIYFTYDSRNFALSALMFIVGSPIILLGVIGLFAGHVGPFVFCLLFGGFFCAVGISFLHGQSEFVLDLAEGCYFNGDTYVPSLGVPRSQQGLIADIYAVQLLKKEEGDSENDNDGRIRYELNFVFKDAERINVLVTRSREENEALALMIGKALGVPIWKGV